MIARSRLTSKIDVSTNFGQGGFTNPAFLYPSALLRTYVESEFSDGSNELALVAMGVDIYGRTFADRERNRLSAQSQSTGHLLANGLSGTAFSKLHGLPSKFRNIVGNLFRLPASDLARTPVEYRPNISGHLVLLVCPSVIRVGKF
jgi:hypothetical protein